MKIISGYYRGNLKNRFTPAFGVYPEAGWELLRDKAYAISLHANLDDALAVAKCDELNGHPRVVVRFDPLPDG